MKSAARALAGFVLACQLAACDAHPVVVLGRAKPPEAGAAGGALGEAGQSGRGDDDDDRE